MHPEREDLNALLGELDPQGPPQWRWVYRAAPGARRIGVLSASFNPPTRAHVALLEAARAAFDVEEGVCLLTLLHVEKPLVGFGMSERLRMLLAIARARPACSVALCNRPRFFEMAQALRDAVGEGPQLFFLIGGDTLIRLFDPRYYPDLAMEATLDRLFAAARLLVAPRPPWDLPALEAFLDDPARASYQQHIAFLTLPSDLAGISSTEVRQRLARREPVDDRVPPEILPNLAGIR
jgi:nicotinamide-nucleotide adenylyltransferase